MELVEHRRGVPRLRNDHQDHQAEDINSRINRVTNGSAKDDDNDQDMLSDCESETSEVLSVGSEPMPTTDGLDVDHRDPRSNEDYESDACTSIATRGLESSREHKSSDGSRSMMIASSPFSGSPSRSPSPSPSPSSSESCNPPQSPASNYCVTPPQNEPSPSSPAASSVRSPASSSATASSPGRPDSHQEAIVPRFQSASSSLHHQTLGGIHQNHHHHHHHHQQQHQSHHLLTSGRYAAAAVVSTTRDCPDLSEYTSVVSGSAIARIPGIIGHHAIGLTASSHGASTVADLLGYSQQSLDSSRLHSRGPPTINVPLVTRLSLSPPTAMTVTGLQATAPSTAFHPVVVAAAAAAANSRDHREANSLLTAHTGHLQIPAVQHPLLHQQPGSQVQHVPATTAVLHHHHHHHHNTQQNHHNSHHPRQNSSQQSAGQHRLSVSKLLQHNNQDSSSTRESSSPVSPGPRSDDHHHNHHHDLSRSNLSPGNNSLQNSLSVSSGNNNSSHQRNNNNSNDNNLQHQASLKFSIDNILKADFGRRITDPISLKKSRPKKVVPRPIDLTKDFIESSSEGSERGSETSTTNPSPGIPTTGNNNGTGTPTGNNISSGGSTGGSASGATTEPTKQMLWPAWVYCTRYSDRPSSGELTQLLRLQLFYRYANMYWAIIIRTVRGYKCEKRDGAEITKWNIHKCTNYFQLKKVQNKLLESGYDD